MRTKNWQIDIITAESGLSLDRLSINKRTCQNKGVKMANLLLNADKAQLRILDLGINAELTEAKSFYCSSD